MTKRTAKKIFAKLKELGISKEDIIYALKKMRREKKITELQYKQLYNVLCPPLFECWFSNAYIGDVMEEKEFISYVCKAIAKKSNS